MCKEGSDVRFAKLDWKDPMNERLFQKGDNEDSTARQRKLNDLYGVNSVNRKTYKGDEFDRKALEYQIQKDHPLENEAQIMKRVQNVSSLEGSGYTSQPSITKDRQSKNYEIKNFTNIDQVNIKDIEKLMRNKGMHIYGVKTQDYYMDSNQKERVLFSIRENSDETTFNNKLNEIKEQLKKEQGLEIEEVSNVRKNISKQKEEQAPQEIIHSRVKKGERISQMGYVNHKYKNK